MRKILTMLVGLFFSINALANQVSPHHIKELLSLCNSINPEETEKCSGYIWGVGDTLVAEQAMNGKNIQYDINVERYTELNLMTVEIAIKAILNNNKAKLNYPAVTIVIEAYQLLGVWKYKNDND
jgi:hypothetical protein